MAFEPVLNPPGRCMGFIAWILSTKQKVAKHIDEEVDGEACWCPWSSLFLILLSFVHTFFSHRLFILRQGRNLMIINNHWFALALSHHHHWYHCGWFYLPRAPRIRWCGWVRGTRKSTSAYARVVCHGSSRSRVSVICWAAFDALRYSHQLVRCHKRRRPSSITSFCCCCCMLHRF